MIASYEMLLPDGATTQGEDISRTHVGIIELYRKIHDEFVEFTQGRVEGDNQYTSSPSYLKLTMDYHANIHLVDLQRWFNNRIQGTVVDVGCATGVVGLSLAHKGMPVAFHDFEGIGLEFIRWYAQKHHLDYTTIPYGQPIAQYDWAIALDVLEHTPNPLTFLRWISELGKNVFITYPCSIDFQPPYEPLRTDEWTDDEAIVWVVEKRYEMFLNYRVDGRRYIGFKSSKST